AKEVGLSEQLPRKSAIPQEKTRPADRKPVLHRWPLSDTLMGSMCACAGDPFARSRKPPAERGTSNCHSISGRATVSDTKSGGITRRELLKTSGQIAAASTLAGMTLPHVYAGEDNTIRVALVGCGGRGTGAAANALSTPS